MSCRAVQIKLSAYLDGEMTGSEMLSVRAHVNQCPDCRQELESLRNIQLILRGLPIGAEPSPAAIESVLRVTSLPKRSLLPVGIGLAIPVLVLSFVLFPRPKASNSVKRDQAINRQLASDQIFDAGTDSTSGASLVHYANFEGR
jgi:anti-sigma factor RsiW